MAWRRRYPFHWMSRDMEDLMLDIERIWGPAAVKVLPPGGIADLMLPAIRGEFRVDVRELEDEVVVAADLPGMDREDIGVNLINPITLEISTDRRMESEEKEKEYFVKERFSGSMKRMIVLPREVTEERAKASFKNGVLEIRLQKAPADRGTRISIE
jgi:HSP20 family protein